MYRLVKALDGWWFAEGSATRLAALRLIVGLTAVVFLALRLRQYTVVAATSADLFDPVGPIVLLSRPIPAAAFEMAMVATLIVGVGFMLGWRFAWTGPLFALLFLLVVSYRNSWSMIYHVDNLLVLHVLVLGLTRSADALSLDALGGRSIFDAWDRFVAEGGARATRPPWEQAGQAASDRPAWHWEYGYPIRLLCAVTVAVYALSAIAKLAGPYGLTWALGESLRNQIGFDALRKELLEGGAGPLAYIVFNHLPLAAAIGTGAIVLELGAIVALYNERIGRLWAVAAYGMHWGIYAVMSIAFWYHLTGLAFAPFLVSEGLVAWCRERAIHQGRTRTVLRT